jgi:hypothetical protein
MIYSENTAMRAAVIVAEGVRQAACAGATQAACKTAEVTFYRTLVSAALTNGVNPDQFITALQELGTGGT